MRKPTQLGYCTTCHQKIWTFDTQGKPIRRKPDYCEAFVQLSNQSRTRLAFCKACLEKGFDAEEAMLNVVDGVQANMENKKWSQALKTWHLGHYEGLKITQMLQAKQLRRGHQPAGDPGPLFVPKTDLGEVKNLYTGPIEKRETPPPPAGAIKEILGEQAKT